MISYVPFKDLLLAVVDNRGKSCPVGSEGRPLIATNCVKNANLYPTYETTRFVSDETCRTWFRGHPQPGDLIFVTKGSPGQVCLAPDPVDFCIAQDMVALRADSAKIYPPYLLAALRSPTVQHSIGNMHVGTLIPHFKKGDFDKLKIPLPSREDQIAVGDIYLRLSQKLELNRRMNETLEAMAQAIFRDWFVDFGPTRRKLAGITVPVEIMGGLTPDFARAAEVAALFPDALGDNGLPVGWVPAVLAEVTSELRRGVSPAYIDRGGVCVLNQKCIRDRQISIGPSRRHDAAKKGIVGRELIVGDVLVNSTGVGTLGRVAQIWEISEPTIVDSHVTVVRANPTKVSPIYLGLNLTAREVEIEALGEGSTGQTELSRVRLGKLDVLLPSRTVMDIFDDIVRPLVERVGASRQESETLANTRDLLLPKLMSGEIRLRDAEAAIEAAT